MKNLFSILAISLCTCVYSQTVTDSIATPIGDFVVISEESTEQSNEYAQETATTSDGGSINLITAGISSERMSSSRIVSALNVTLAPNPTSGLVELNITGVEGATTVVVTNVLGQIVYSNSVQVNSSRTMYLPAQLWLGGTYMVVISAGGQTVSKRLIVE